jgi:hypothetical protein
MRAATALAPAPGSKAGALTGSPSERTHRHGDAVLTAVSLSETALVIERSLDGGATRHDPGILGVPTFGPLSPARGTPGEPEAMYTIGPLRMRHDSRPLRRGG